MVITSFNQCVFFLTIVSIWSICSFGNIGISGNIVFSGTSLVFHFMFQIYPLMSWSFIPYSLFDFKGFDFIPNINVIIGSLVSLQFIHYFQTYVSFPYVITKRMYSLQGLDLNSKASLDLKLLETHFTVYYSSKAYSSFEFHLLLRNVDNKIILCFLSSFNVYNWHNQMNSDDSHYVA